MTDKYTMTSLWIIIGLILASISVSLLGATFSVVGLGALFSGAVLAVCAMAGSLELAKFVLAAYLHQRWKDVNIVMKTYLLFSIIVLSAITSMGIFGFLSNAYQSASNTLEAELIRVEALKVQRNNNNAEIARLNKSIDEIPIERLTKKLAIRARFEPAIAAIIRNSEQIDKQVADSNIKILDIKQKVGPLIYISRAFKIDIDSVVKYLILVFVSVFDPLAICLVVATTEALDSRRKAVALAKLEAKAAAMKMAQEEAQRAKEELEREYLKSKIAPPIITQPEIPVHLNDSATIIDEISEEAG